MNNKQIKIIIDKEGNPVIKAEGFAGEGCLEATKSFENIFSGGEDNMTVEKTEDFYSVDNEEEPETENEML